MIFTDDTNIFLEGKNVTEICNVMSVQLEKILSWLQANKLTLNMAKTQYMCCRLARNKLEVSHPIYISIIQLLTMSTTVSLLV